MATAWAVQIASSCTSLLLSGNKASAAEPERHTYETDQDRHFNQWADYRRKGDRRAKAERGDGNRDSELKVIASGCESSGGGLAVISTYHFPHQEADKEHNDEIDCERNGNADHVEWEL